MPTNLDHHLTKKTRMLKAERLWHYRFVENHHFEDYLVILIIFDQSCLKPQQIKNNEKIIKITDNEFRIVVCMKG